MLIAAIPGDGRAVLDLPGHGPVTGGALHAWAHADVVRAWRADFRGERVGVRCRNQAALALTLLALDGAAAAIILLPAEVSPESLAELERKAGVTRLITDLPDARPEAAWPPVYRAIVSGVPCGAGSGAEGAQVLATEWVLPTSGTTRTPKLVAHTLETLTKSVKRDPAKGAGVVWGLLYDLNRFAGLQVFLQALLGGGCLVLPEPMADLAASLVRFAATGCTALSATPTLWRKILMSAEADMLRLRQVTLGGEVADAGILAALTTRFPAARVVHIYASTEAGVGFAVTDGREGFPAAYLDTGVPGVRLRVNADDILELQPDRRGQRYLGESEALANDAGWVVTGDRLRRTADRVYFLGRDSGAINVGGNKVQPEEVERVLLAHPGVALAAVGAKRSGITGSLVEARVVLRPGVLDPAAAIGILRSWCVERLERHQVPALLRVVPALEVGATGKIARP